MSGEENDYYLMCNLSGPIMVSLDITEKCNFKCAHCYNNSGLDKNARTELSHDEMMTVIDQIVELKPFNVCLCGGETLLREDILDLIAYLSSRKIAVSIVTNGYLIGDAMANNLVRAGVQQVQISLDGCNSFQHDNFRGQDGAFVNAVNAINNLRTHGVPHLVTSFVPNLLNYQSVSDYINLCKDLGVNVVRMMPLIPSGRGKTLGKKLILDDFQYHTFQKELIQAKFQYGSEIIIEWGDPVDHMRRMPNNAKLGISTYSFDIKVNGDIKPTAYLPIVAGNVFKDTARNYWEKGYKFIWKNKRLLSEVNKIATICDFETYEPDPNGNEIIYLNIGETE